MRVAPGLAGFLMSRDRGMKEDEAEMKQGLTLQAVLEKQKAAQRQKAYETEIGALGPDATDEQVISVATKYAGPEKTLGARQQALTQRTIAEGNKESSLARVEMQGRFNDMQHEIRLRNAATAEERAAEIERHNRAREANEAQMNALRLEIAQLRNGQQQRNDPMNLTEIVDPKEPTKMLRVDARRFNRDRYLAGDMTGVVGQSGKEPGAQKKEEGREQGKRQITEIADALAGDYGILQSRGALVDPANSGARNVWERAAASGPGQLIAGAVGTEAQQVRDRIKTQRPLLMAAIKQSSGMSAQQMNSNMELQFYLQAATDPTMGYDTNLAALAHLDKTYGLGTGVSANPQAVQALERIHKQRFGDRPQAPAAPGGGGAKFEEGKVYVDAQGNKARYQGGQWVPVQ
jgi:hypothetical protein